jgi:hypothetical protein
MKVLLIVGAVPLLVYPFAAMASLMSLAAHTSGKEPVLMMIAARGFQISSLLDPLVYFGCLVAAVALKGKGRGAMAGKIASVPLFFLVLIAVFFVGWLKLEG